MSVQQLERALSLDAHSLDPTDLIATLAPVAETSFTRRHDVEYRQLKRGKEFEDWLVFRLDLNAPVRPKVKPKPAERRPDTQDPKVQPKPRVERPDPGVHDDQIRRPDTARLREKGPTPRRTGGRDEHAAMSDPDPEPITVPLLPLSKTRFTPSPLDLNKSKSFFGGGLFNRAKREEPEDKLPSQPAPVAEPQVISLPAPHKMAGMPHLDIPSVAAAPSQMTGIAQKVSSPRDPFRSRETNGQSPSREAAPRAAAVERQRSEVTGELRSEQPKTAGISAFLKPAEAKPTLLASSGTVSKLEKEAALRRRAAEKAAVDDALRPEARTRGSSEAIEAPPGGGKLLIEVEPLSSSGDDEQPPETALSPVESASPLSASPSGSQYSSESEYSEAPTPSTTSSILEDAEEPLPPTPWLDVVFHDLPFGPGAPAVCLSCPVVSTSADIFQLQVSEWLQDRWQLLAAQVVAILACAYVVHATGM